MSACCFMPDGQGPSRQGQGAARSSECLGWPGETPSPAVTTRPRDCTQVPELFIGHLPSVSVAGRLPDVAGKKRTGERWEYLRALGRLVLSLPPWRKWPTVSGYVIAIAVPLRFR